MLPSYPLKYTWHHIVIVGCIRFISSISLCPMFFFKKENVKRRSNDASSVSCSICLVNLTTFLRHIGWKLPAAPAFVDLIKSLLHGKIMAKSSVFLVEYPEIHLFPSRISWNQQQNHQQNPHNFPHLPASPSIFHPQPPRGATRRHGAPPLGARRSALAEDALLWNLRAGGWPFSLVVQVPEEPGGICFHCRNR